MRRKATRPDVSVVARVALWLLAAVGLFPLYYMIANAFREGREYASKPGSPPGTFTFENFTELFTTQAFPTWLLNSVILTSSSVVISIAAAVLAAHGLTYFRLPGSEAIVKGMAALMVVPVILLVIPLFVQFARLGLLDTYAGAILVYAGVTLPFATFLLTRFFAAVPKPLIEAATIDGASAWAVLVRVVLPLARPAVITLAVVSAFYVWNDLLIALVLLQSDDLKPLMVGLTTIAGRETRDVPITLAAASLSVIPIVVLYLMTQRVFVRGIYGGAMRGE